MSPSVKNIIYSSLVILFAGFMLFHFLFTFIYSTGGRYTSHKINEITGQYILPLFHHNWQVFAPDPAICQPSLLERHKTSNNTGFTKWALSGYAFFKKSQCYRTGYTSRFFRLNDQYSREILSLMEGVQANTIERSRAYNLALEYAVLCLQKEGLNPTKIQIGVVCAPITAQSLTPDTIFFDVEEINQLH